MATKILCFRPHQISLIRSLISNEYCWNSFRTYSIFSSNSSQPRNFARLLPFCTARNFGTSFDQIVFKKETFESDELSKSPIFNAPNLALQTGRLDDFVNTVHEWFLEMKGRLDQLKIDQFNAASILANLGQINRRTDGQLFEKLGYDWQLIEYFLERMLDEKYKRFEDYTPEEIVAALAGIRDFTIYAKDSISDRSIFVSWLREFGTYVTNMKTVDPGYCFLERRAPYVLFLLSGLASIQKLPPGLLHRLCCLSKLWFDQRLTEVRNESDEENQMNPISHDKVASFYYSDAFLFWLYDPNSVIENSWTSWFGICNFILESNLKQFRGVKNDEKPPVIATLRMVSRVVSIAAEYDVDEEFWAIFNLWKRALMEVLYRCSAPSYVRDQIKEDIDATRVDLSDFVYNLGLLTKKLQQSGDQYRNRFEHLLPMLDGALANVGIRDGLSHNRALSGFRNLKMYAGDFELSSQYYRMIQNWCSAERRTAVDSGRLSDAAAAIMFQLKSMKLRQHHSARLRTLEELILLFRHDLENLNGKNTNLTLAYFGDACLNFDIDPERICSRDGGNDIWHLYFEKAKECLVSQWPARISGYNESRRWKHLISILADVAYRYNRTEEFRSMYEIYERRLISILEWLTVSQCHFLNRTLLKMQDREFRVDQKLLRDLERKGASFVPKLRYKSGGE